MGRPRKDLDEVEQEIAEEENLDEEQQDENLENRYANDNIDSDLDIYRKNIEPKSQELGFVTNTRDLKMSNIGASTELFIHNMSLLAEALEGKYEPRGLFPKGFFKTFYRIRDRVLITANSREGYWQNLQQQRTITHHKINEDVTESKPIFVHNLTLHLSKYILLLLVCKLH